MVYDGQEKQIEDIKEQIRMTQFKFEQLQDLIVQMDCLQNIWENIQMSVEEEQEQKEEQRHESQNYQYDQVEVIKPSDYSIKVTKQSDCN